MEDMIYNGTSVIWRGTGRFKATSGMPGFQLPSQQCIPDAGPVPEGTYAIALILGDEAKDDGSGRCALKPSWQIERIPRGTAARECEPYWANWGHNRVRFEPADSATRSKCRPIRGGFYLHDSTKGFSHGCIEIETRFFSTLRVKAKSAQRKKLILKVEYTSSGTNGGTYVK